MNLKMIIFDMDGVLLDSEPLHEKSRQIMYKEFNIEPDESFPNPVGKCSRGFWQGLIDLGLIEGDSYAMETRQYALVAQQIKDDHVQPSEGFWDIVNWAKENNVKIALASSSTRVLVNDSLRYLNVTDCFDYTTSGDEVANKKPAPDVYLKVLEMAGVSPEDAIAIEDSSVGVAAAKAAGVFCYGYHNETSGVQDLTQSDRIVESLTEVAEMIKTAL